MTIEFIGMISHRHASEIYPPGPEILDRGYVRDFAQAAEAATFDRVLVGYFSDGPTGFCFPQRRQRIPSVWAFCSRTGPALWRRRWRHASSQRSIRSLADGRRST